nr:hydroxymethylglutaryl-CoA lyase [uncultured Oscillibacter sp.]
MKEKCEIYLKEVGPRDGFQMEQRFIPTEKKIEIIDRLSESGVKKIQFTAFMHPKAIPNMADAERVVEGIRRVPGVVYQGLIANKRGYERANAAGVEEVEFTLSATESHNISNVNASTEESFLRMEECLKLGGRMRIVGGVAVAFGCPFEGRPPIQRVEWIVSRFRELGIREVTLADTAGVGVPTQVYEVFSHMLEKYPDMEFCFHPHNTHGTALCNALAALKAGITMIDASTAGLGGCPFSPGASGNLAMEDLVDVLETMGYETGVNLDIILDAGRMMQAAAGHSDSATLKSGKMAALVKEAVCGQNNRSITQGGKTGL